VTERGGVFVDERWSGGRRRPMINARRALSWIGVWQLGDIFINRKRKFKLHYGALCFSVFYGQLSSMAFGYLFSYYQTYAHMFIFCGIKRLIKCQSKKVERIMFVE